MTDPLSDRDRLTEALEVAANEARRYLADLGSRPVLDRAVEETVRGWSDPMPEQGDGTLAAVSELAARGHQAATRSSGPRFFHFVMGGGTPAALAADWLTSAYDQVAFGWASSPMASRLEQVTVDWLRQLFELPEEFGGVFTTGATMANFVALAAARNWWAEQQGVDVDQVGLAGLPAPPILSSGYIHPSAVQAVGMLGMGQGNVERLARDAAGCLDSDALEARLRALDAPAILVANAGEVNAGDFDPIEQMADLAAEHGAWLHVDGAFGLFARLAPEARDLAAGVERADSIIADGHKWLNVPYDCGFAFVRDPARLARTFNVGAPYLPSPDDPHPNPGFLTPENSRRARALSVWATLRAYGRRGHREMVERHLALARRLGKQVDDLPQLEPLAPIQLNIVCFRARPEGVPHEELDALNHELGEALLRDGRVFAGTTIYDGKVAFRPAIVNWSTERGDVDLLVNVLLELLEGMSG
ncbi:MAG: pyridoxal phosphate-dependent decarboxylase family protein [Solirubrobacterales bacterium]